jgi:hypothetical protein
MSKATDLDALKAKFQSGSYIKFPLKNVILRHIHLEKPDNHFDPGGDGKFSVCAIIPEDVAEDMKACGFNVKKFEDGENYVKATRKPALGKTTVMDHLGGTVSNATIGNGSVADLDATTKYWNIGGKPSQAIYIEGITVTDLVVYAGGDEDDDFDPFA